MPTYMDEHDIPGVTAAGVAEAHEADVKVQGKYGVNYKHYWVDEEKGHAEAHGLTAHTLFEVKQGA